MAIHQLPWYASTPAACRGRALSVGHFGGVRRRPVALLEELRRQSESGRCPAVALTFDPHPLQLLRPDNYPPPLTTIAERARLLQAHGADQVVILGTTHDFLRL